MANNISKWIKDANKNRKKRLHKRLRVVPLHSLNTIAVQSGVSLTGMKKTAKDNADTMRAEASSKNEAASKLLEAARALAENSAEIRDALEALDAAEGKL